MATPLTQRLRDGIAAAQARQFDRARELLEPIARVSPDDPLVWFWLAVAAPSADVAIPCLRKVLGIDASHVQARDALATLLVAQAGQAALAGHRTDARTLAVEAAELAPDAEAAWLAIAAVSDDRFECIEALRRAVTLNPQPATRTRLRQVLVSHAMTVANSDRATARALLREGASLDPDDLRVWHALTLLADTPADALAAVRELIRLAPDDPAGRTLLMKALVADARALEAAGQPEEACSRWREAVTLDTHDIDAWLGLAQSTPDDDEAQKAIEAAFDIDPSDERVPSVMARVQAVPLDPAAFELPPDAFARLGPSEDVFARVEPAPDVFAQYDFSANPFAPFAASPDPTAAEPAQTPTASAALTAAPVPAPASTPVPTPDPTVTPGPTPAPMAAESDGPLRRTVMIVDDSPTIRKILGLTLERAGYTVVAEPDGESAVERLTDVVPDVILLDIAMPKLDGYEVCKRIKKDPRTAHVPVVMLSGKDAFFDKVKGRMVGATEYLTKPFETPDVLAAVSTACEPTPVVANG